MKININKWIERIISRDERKAIPIMTHPGIELSGESVRKAVTNGTVHAKAVELLAGKYPSAASSTIMDLTVEAEAFGAEIDFPENDVPCVTGRLVSDRESIESLKIPEVDNGRAGEYLKACKLISENTDRPLFAGCIGPYSLAGRLYDMSEIMTGIYIEPDTMNILLDKCSRYILKYCLAMKESGANGIIMAEPAAGLLSNEFCSKFSSRFVKSIVEQVQDENFAVILHNCGNTGQCTEAMVETRAAGYHFGNAADMTDVLKQCPHSSLVMGNIDPVSIMKDSTPECVFEHTSKLLHATASYRNFILSTGCDTPPGVPFENIDAFYNSLETFNSTK